MYTLFSQNTVHLHLLYLINVQNLNKVPLLLLHFVKFCHKFILGSGALQCLLAGRGKLSKCCLKKPWNSQDGPPVPSLVILNGFSGNS